MDAKILLVEDEPTNMAILAAYLRTARYSVEEAADGRAAWAKLTSGNIYDLVITDRMMPNMDGLELAMRMNKHAQLRSVPVIMQTSAATQEEIQEGVKAGVFYYLTKPYEEETLLGIARSALQEKRRRDIFDENLKRQRDALSTIANGEFHVRTLHEAENVALLIGGIFPRPELAVSGLYELILNGIEHGNLGIGYERKNKMLSEKTFDQELAARLAQPENQTKKVVIKVIRTERQIDVTITDDGPGFDPRPYFEIEPSRATKGAGRGIAKANLLCFDKIEYLGKGNSLSVSNYYT